MKQAFDFSRDLMAGFLDKAGKQKDQLVSALSREFVKFLEQINIAEEVQKILDGMTLEVSAKIDFSKKKSALSLGFDAKPKPKSNPKAKKKNSSTKKVVRRRKRS